jgi:general secretion pathway protein N
VWAGHIYDARLGKIALGDVDTHVVPMELLKGRLRIDMLGTNPVSELHGGFSHGLGGLGLDEFSVAAGVAAQSPIPAGTLFVEKLTARFPGGQCGSAEGRGRAFVSSPFAGVVQTGSMTGPALCRDGALAFDLANDTGAARQEIAVGADGSYNVRATIKPESAAVAARLQSQGFIPGPDGYVYQAQRTL